MFIDLLLCGILFYHFIYKWISRSPETFIFYRVWTSRSHEAIICVGFGPSEASRALLRFRCFTYLLSYGFEVDKQTCAQTFMQAIVHICASSYKVPRVFEKQSKEVLYCCIKFLSSLCLLELLLSLFFLELSLKLCLEMVPRVGPNHQTTSVWCFSMVLLTVF